MRVSTATRAAGDEPTAHLPASHLIRELPLSEREPLSDSAVLGESGSTAVVATGALAGTEEETVGREPRELVQSADQWRVAGTTGDLGALLHGLRWLQETWPRESAYESRLHSALHGDLQGVKEQYAAGKISSERGYECVAGVVEIIDALWESRSGMPPAARVPMLRATRVALSRAESGDPAPALELLDLLSQHWQVLASERASDDGVRVALLDVNAFWSASSRPDDEADLAGFESLVEHLDQLFVRRAAAATGRGEALRGALVVLLARWRRRGRTTRDG